MALHDEISNQTLKICLNAISSQYFTTLNVISELEKNFPDEVTKVRSFSERNWRAIIGKAIKRFSVETNLIKQITDAKQSPAIWKKM